MEIGEAKTILAEWLNVEMLEYADAKHNNPDALDTNHGHWAEGLQQGSWWEHYLTMYFQRAQILQCPDTMVGKQAMLKHLSTTFNACVMMIMECGAVPKPGVSSGEIQEWLR